MGLLYSDIPELEGTDTDVVLSNLRALEKELGETLEKRIAHLCELARAILKDGGDADVVKSIILSIRSDGEISPTTFINDNEKELKMLFSSISLIERLVVFKEVFGDRYVDDLLAHSALPLSDKSMGRISYVKNSYNDTAFGYFSTLVDGAKASYYDNLSDVCESVLSGRSQFCLLPIETEKDGRLLSFYSTVMSYDLKINAELDLRTNESSSYTRYALLSSALQARKSKYIRGFLEISYADTDNLSIKDLILSAEYCGLEIYSIDTLFLDGNKSINIVFEAGRADVKAFLAYLSVDCPDHTVIGYYQRFNSEK